MGLLISQNETIRTAVKSSLQCQTAYHQTDLNQCYMLVPILLELES